MPKVAQLFRSPIKSTQLQKVERLDFDIYGPAGDRRWLITCDDYANIITQRNYPKLNRVAVEVLSSSAIDISIPNHGTFSLTQSDQNPLVKSNIWKNYFQARDAGDEVATFLSDFLEIPVRLVGLDPEFDRKVKEHPNDQVAFADGYPVLIISQASLNWLNDKLDQPVSIERFRPNIVVEDCDAFEEDRWKRIKIGDVILKASGPCARCIMTTIDPSLNAFAGIEPLKTLSEYRKAEQGILFGQNYVNETKSGKIVRDAPLEILGPVL